MRCASSKLQARARILELGLNAAQARNAPLSDSTRTVSPLSALPRAMADSKIQGWRRCNERSLPARNRMVFIDRHCAAVRATADSNAKQTKLSSPFSNEGASLTVVGVSHS